MVDRKPAKGQRAPLRAEPIDLRSLLNRYLTTRLDYDQADRSIPLDAEDGTWEAKCLAPCGRFSAASEALREGVMLAMGFDPGYAVPRPIAAVVDGFVVGIFPDMNDSCHRDRDGRFAAFGWRLNDILDVASRSDVLTLAPAAEPTPPARKARGKARR